MGKINAKLTPKTSPSSRGNRVIKQEIVTPPASPSPRRSQLQRTRRPEDDVPSTSEPPAKRGRSSVCRILKPSEIKQEEGTTLRRRRTLKHGEVAPPKCCFCQKEQTDDLEPLKECFKCKGSYHIQQCLRYKDDFARNIAFCESWCCPRCVECGSCKNYVSDPFNVECTLCCKAFHGGCVSDESSLQPKYGMPWICSECNQWNKLNEQRSACSRPDPAPTSSRLRNGKRKKSPLPVGMLEFENGAEELTEILNQRDSIWERLNRTADFSAKLPIGSPEKTQNYLKNGTIRRSSLSDVLQLDVTRKVEQLTLPVDREMYRIAHEQAYGKVPVAKTKDGFQWLHFATGMGCKTIYKSAYEEPRGSAKHLYCCKFCLHTTHLKDDFELHFDRCEVNLPPGNEIYRNDGLSFFEVDGANQRKYCQDLCLLAKLFIASKTLYDEVETFIFYVLCELTPEGFVMVGYFSKEKNPSKNNNLSCLMVLPTAQKRGYGQMLIDMSYELSRIERRVGHPEHPLSDLGILAYRTYWRSSLLCYLRSKKNTDKISLKDMCLQTRITQVDIVNQLMLDNIIVLKDGVYYIKIGKRALKYPLSQSRRRAVKASMIKWAPKPTGEILDPRKINTYV